LSIKGDARYAKARAWLNELIASDGWIGIPWVSVWAFLRVVTNRRVSARPVDAEVAFDIVQAWTELPNVVILQPGPRHADLLRTLVVRGQATGPMITDAVLAAITIEQGATLASTDQDFSRFPGLSWFNPLAPTSNK
jgi:toxin-antitoxin system PIN domain toxin